MQISSQVLAAAIGAILASLFAIVIGFMNNRYDLERERRRYKREKALELLILINKTNKLYMDKLSCIIAECATGILSINEAVLKDFNNVKSNMGSIPSTLDTASYVTLFFPSLTTAYYDLEKTWLEASGEYNHILLKRFDYIKKIEKGGCVNEANSNLLDELNPSVKSFAELMNKSEILTSRFSKMLSLEFNKI